MIQTGDIVYLKGHNDFETAKVIGVFDKSDSKQVFLDDYLQGHNHWEERFLEKTEAKMVCLYCGKIIYKKCDCEGLLKAQQEYQKQKHYFMKLKE